ncbi:hypothetical protein [Candidatus Trichorickettsia mobilis]|uniref:hypothetical protein n=1 Tax=Candidatus Trichorickettsia mobilis TaxID=1346319 RepID=UPI00292F4899|nr:hypothetical protein [Candidatus Trichorickettsia mobilis]
MKTKLIIDDITDTELVTRIEKTNINAVDENNNEEAMDKKIITIDNDCTTHTNKKLPFFK